MLGWIIGIILVVVILILLNREIYFYEGVHLGPRVQGWLYDRWAARYDADKRESQSQDAEVLARPLLNLLAETAPDTTNVLILDVATGTGRFPAVLLREPTFQGQIVALDLSREMLALAAEKTAPFKNRVTLIRQTALRLPFPDNSFDVVSCLEALELMPNMAEPLAEFARVLRPGGVLLTTRGTEASGRVAKILSADKFTALLQTSGFERIEIVPWWRCFDRVWARKAGQSVPVGARTVTDVLQCSACGRVALTTLDSGALRCRECQAEIAVTPEGILLL